MVQQVRRHDPNSDPQDQKKKELSVTWPVGVGDREFLEQSG